MMSFFLFCPHVYLMCACACSQHLGPCSKEPPQPSTSTYLEGCGFGNRPNLSLVPLSVAEQCLKMALFSHVPLPPLPERWQFVILTDNSFERI